MTAVAVPNFIKAKHNTNYSRTKSDLRTLATAVEAYTADYGLFPVDYSTGTDGDPDIPSLGISAAVGTSGICHPGFFNGTMHPGLTTPVPYVTNCWMYDPYAAGNSFQVINADEQFYSYQWLTAGPVWGRQRSSTNGFIVRNYAGYYGKWRLGSIGPDRSYYNGGSTNIHGSRVYDPTNGTMSYGNIWRGEKLPEVSSRPPLDIQIDPAG